MTTIALLGLGRVGKRVYKIAETDKDFNVLFAIDDYAEDTHTYSLPVIRTNQFSQTITTQKPDIIIDFSHPDATMAIAPIAMQHGIHMVTCTTGFTETQICELKDSSNNADAALLLAPNITPGINLWMAFAKIASRVLQNYDTAITDYHFKEKKDPVSATAKKLSDELLSIGAKADVYGVRAGDIVGTHTVLFAGEQDQIEITHQSYTKDIFAKSALNAAKAIIGKTGFLEMKDILNYKDIAQACL